ncbi:MULTISPECIES: HlyD family efflux transporter periplasmic adaptor subunit [Hyphomicrobiales]|uniref:HlyD family efflux transporter periplasmic adaptor subunit n=1 Tax=Bosea massiliensis TaxID=151419 RepID=A0ABW0P5J6_9HYPH|nr:HlyD family efflux transporter periplasmic adaptor subunit [Methylobacterium sp. CCH7-A2]
MADSTTASMFRSEALDARGRIEALPTTMHVTDSWTRAVIGGVALAVLAALVASTQVIIPIQIPASGVVVDRSGYLLTAVPASAGGFVEALKVRAGDHVVKGQELGRLTLPEQSETITRLRGALEGLKRDDLAMAALAEQDRRSEQAVRDRNAANLDARIASHEQRIGWLQQRQNAEAELLRKGISTETRIIAARIALQEAIAERDQMRFERSSLQSAALEAEARRERERLGRALKIEQAAIDLAAAEANQAVRQVLRAPVDGVVAEVPARVGESVSSGEAIVVVMAQGGSRAEDLEAVLFVPLGAGKRVSQGDRVLIAPASLPQGEHDRLLGRVGTVSSTVTTRDSLRSTLGSEQLAELAAREGPVFRLVVELEKRDGDPSRLAWTSGGGPNLSLTRGTPVSAQITTEHTSLLSLALPALRRLFEPSRSVWTDRG